MLSCRRLGFEWPNGQLVFHDFNFDFSQRRLALIGPNGVGKSTLLRVLAGELQASQGDCRRSSGVVYLSQEEERPDLKVWEYLGDLEQPPELWERLPMMADCKVLSGGEWMLLRLVKRISERPGFLLLDEPTNHLDEGRKAWLMDLLENSGAGYLLVTHDRDVLQRMQEFLVLTPDHIQFFAGSWEDYQIEKSSVIERSQNAVADAKTALARQEQQARLNEERQAKRMRQAARTAPDAGIPKILLGARKRQAQETAGGLNRRYEGRLREGRRRLALSQAERLEETRPTFKIKRSRSITGKDLVRLENARILKLESVQSLNLASAQPLWDEELNFVLKGGERLWIRGENGAGKTSLLRSLQGCKVGPGLLQQGVFRNYSRFWGELNQEPVVDGSSSVWDWFREHLGGADSELRNSLAQFQFPMERLQQSCSSLSGGERLRAHLARLLLAEDPPEILFLDEPTNHLDLLTREWLEQILHEFDGALVLVTHEEGFARALGVEKDIRLTRRSNRGT